MNWLDFLLRLTGITILGTVVILFLLYCAGRTSDWPRTERRKEPRT